MAKPRLVLRSSAQRTEGRQKLKGNSAAISSIVLVPSNELADQYMSWARQLIPPSVAAKMDSVIQCVKRGDEVRSPDQQVRDLLDNPPHILVATPRRAMEILEQPGGAAILGLSSLRTLVLDEVDSLLDLPGKYPSAKTIWKNIQHPPPGLSFLNDVMRLRGTYSGGSLIPSAGMEVSHGYEGSERRPPEHIRRTQHRSNERMASVAWLNPPKILRRNETPLQLVACSASANAILRHFLGAKTGWLRLGIRAKDQDSLVLGRREAQRDQANGMVTGRWIDLTGLSGDTGPLADRKKQEELRESLARRGELTRMPKELQHCCIVVDEGPPDSSPPMRNFSPKRLGKSLGTDPRATSELTSLLDEKDPNLPPVNLKSRKAKNIVKEVATSTKANLDKLVVHSFALEGRGKIDDGLLEALAYAFVAEGAMRSLVFIPPGWSLRSTEAMLSELGLPIVSLEELKRHESRGTATPAVALLQSTSGRGLDLPHLSHVFIVGTDALGDAVQYTHLAGRASRLSGFFSATSDVSHLFRSPGRVITLVRGLKAEHQIRNESILETWKTMDSIRRVGQSIGASVGKPLLISTAEQKISAVYRTLRITPRRVKLGVPEFDEPFGEESDLSEEAEAEAGEVLNEGKENHINEARASAEAETGGAAADEEGSARVA